MAILRSTAQHVSHRRSDPSEGVSKEAIAGITVASGAICIAIICVVCLLIRATLKRKRDAWRIRQSDPEMRRQTVREITNTNSGFSRPRKVLSRSNLLPYTTNPGWGSLASQESMEHTAKTQRISGRSMPNFSKVIKHDRGWPRKGRSMNIMPLRRFPSLQVPESSSMRPRVKSKSHTPLSIREAQVKDDPSVDFGEHEPEKDDPSAINFDTPSMQDLTALIGKENMRNLKPQPLFIATPKQQARAARSMTIGSGVDYSPNLRRIVDGHITKSRPSLHARSISLGGYQPCPAPNIPVPPLPLIQKIDRAKSAARRMIEHSPSRHSDSSLESVGSSLLGLKNSPRIQRNDTLPLGSRTDHIQQSPFANWDDRARAMVTSNTFNEYRFCHEPKPTHHISDGTMLQQITRANTISSLRGRINIKHHLSAPDITTARRTSSISSISSNSYQGTEYIPHSFSTPTRYSRSRTTIYGSPCERRKTPHVRTQSRCNITPVRHPSVSSLRAPSTRSSDGNPFQWDRSPVKLGKPSALKGSPGARKGQKRQNSVRISLAPTILGPYSQSPTSSVMNDIREESSEQESAEEVISLEEISGTQPKRELPRPPSTSTFAPVVNIDVKSIEASLTDNSPTLSLVDFREELPVTSSKRTPLSEIPSPQFPGSPNSRNSSFFSILNSPEASADIALPGPVLSADSPYLFSNHENDENTPPTTKLERMLQSEQSYFLDENNHRNDKSEKFIEPFSSPEQEGRTQGLKSPDERKTSTEPSSPSSPCYLPGLKQSRKSQVSCGKFHITSPKHSSEEVVKPERNNNQRHSHCSLTCHRNLHQIALRATPKLPPKSCSPIGSCFESPHSVHKSIIALRRMNSDMSMTSMQSDKRYSQLEKETYHSAYPGSIIELQDEWGDFQTARSYSMENIRSKELEERRSRIWEEGEKFWRAVNEPSVDELSCSRIPGLNIVPPSIQGTPASLYDRDGFLK